MRLKTVLHDSEEPCAPQIQGFRRCGVPQCTRTQRTFKEYLLESAPATGLSRELAVAFTSAKALVQ